MNATNMGVTGSKGFPAAAKALGSVYGKGAAKTFLDGKFQWRAHINFFVDYTVATARKNKAGQSEAVANLVKYTKMHGASSPAQPACRSSPSRTTSSVTCSS